MNNFLKIITAIVLITTTIISSQKDSFAVTFNAANDFSINNNNPNGVWTYGFSSTLGGTFNLYTNNTEPSLTSYNSFDVWNISPPNFLGVYHNYTNNTVTTTSGTITPNQLVSHPGSSGEYSIVRFIAPQSGNYNLATTFTGVDFVGPTTTDVHILQNNFPIFSNSIVGFGSGSTQAFSNNLSLVTGDIIDFAVGFGGNNYFFDSTGLDIIITQDNQPTATPESSNLLGLMLLGGSLGLTKVKLKAKK